MLAFPPKYASSYLYQTVLKKLQIEERQIERLDKEINSNYYFSSL